MITGSISKLKDQNDEIVFPVTSSQCVYMEDGTTKLTDKIGQVDTSLAGIETQKADVTYVNTLTSSIASGSPKGTYATVSALTTAFPSGNTNIYVVTADGNWYYWNGSAWTSGGTYQSTGIVDNSVTTAKRTVLGDQVFLASEYPINIDFTNKKITLSVGWKYIFYRNKFYNLPSTLIEVPSIGGGALAGLFYFDTITNTLKMGYNNNLTETDLLIGHVYSAGCMINCSPYYINGKFPVHLTDNTITTNKRTVLGEQGFLATLEPIVLDFSAKTVTIKSGSKYIFYRNKTITLTTSEIVLSNGGTSINGVLYYNIDTSTFAIGGTGSLTENCLLLGFIYPNAQNLNAHHVVSGLTTSDSKWVGKTFVTIGDSITWYDGHPYSSTNIYEGVIAIGYQTHMRNKMECTVTNKGIGSLDMPLIYEQEVLVTDFTTGIDAVTITSGANDHRKGTPVGTILPIGSVFDTTTYIGALQASIEKILADNRLIKIYLITPIKGWYNEQGTANVPNPTGIGILSENYPNAMKEVGKLYSIPVCDWYSNVGINDINKNDFIGDKLDQAYFLHPNNLGYERMALDILIPFLNNN